MIDHDYRLRRSERADRGQRRCVRLTSCAKARSVTLGLSEAPAPNLRRVHAVYRIAAVQSQFSLFARDMLHNDENAAVDELGMSVAGAVA